MAHGTRGGYCFHLNGAFAELLSSLGYAVTRHVGGVHGPAGATEEEMANHLVLSVTGLPSDDNPDGTWYVDAGLGDALYEPTPLAAATYAQTPFTMRLDETPGAIGDWHLTHDPAGGFAGMAWRSAPATMAAFAEKHQWLSRSPESGFVRVLTLQRREATGVDILRGCVLQRIGEETSTRDLASKTELDDALGDLFGIDLAQLDPDAYAAMWAKMQREHDRWVQAGRP